MTAWQKNVCLRPFTTLRAGGRAGSFARARSAEQLATLALEVQRSGRPTLLLGHGSNVLPADAGVPGSVIVNEAARIDVDAGGEVYADAGASFQELFLRTAQAGLGGLEFAVGIPGTVGGALVSNAGAYRSNVSEFLVGIEIVESAERRWEEPEWMEFSYRDSILRRPSPPPCAILRIRMRLPHRDPKSIYDEAREYQRQRISKQPPPASAGSFFKNVNDRELATRVPKLPDRLREAGVVPAGFLIEHSGLAGHRIGGAMFARRHANFIVNVGGASASDIRRLAELAKSRVREAFGADLEEEVLYVGDWSGWR